MANLDNLPNPSFKLMSPDERMELVRKLRGDRRHVEPKPAKTKLASRAKRAKKPVLTGELAGLSKEELNLLMELL